MRHRLRALLVLLNYDPPHKPFAWITCTFALSALSRLTALLAPSFIEWRPFSKAMFASILAGSISPRVVAAATTYLWTLAMASAATRNASNRMTEEAARCELALQVSR